MWIIYTNHKWTRESDDSLMSISFWTVCHTNLGHFFNGRKVLCLGLKWTLSKYVSKSVYIHASRLLYMLRKHRVMCLSYGLKVQAVSGPSKAFICPTFHVHCSPVSMAVKISVTRLAHPLMLRKGEPMLDLLSSSKGEEERMERRVLVGSVASLRDGSKSNSSVSKSE